MLTDIIRNVVKSLGRFWFLQAGDQLLECLSVPTFYWCNNAFERRVLLLDTSRTNLFPDAF